MCFFMVCFIYGVSLKAQQPTFTLDVKGDPKILDSLTLILEGGFYYQTDDVHNTFLKGKKVEADCIRFEVHTDDSCGYFSLVKKIADERKKTHDHQIVLNTFFWEPKDKITFKLSTADAQIPEAAEIHFTGYGAAKYNARAAAFNSNIAVFPVVNVDEMTITLAKKSELVRMDDLLKKYSADMSKLSFDVLKSDIFFRFNPIKAVSLVNEKLNSQEQRDRLLNDHNKIVELFENSQFSKKALAISMYYKRYYLRSLLANTVLKTGKHRPGIVLERILKEPDQLLHDRLLATYLIENRFDEHFYGLFDSISATLKDKGSISVFNEMKIRYKNLYSKKYEFIDFDGMPINLVKFKGKVVLLDLWFTGCVGCASVYGKSLSKIESQFKNEKNFVAISINVDKKVSIWKKGIGEGLYTSQDGAVNLNVGPKGISHPLIYDWGLQGMPCVVLINKDGGIEFFNTSNLYDPALLVQSILHLLKGNADS